jgi:prepilin-type processing-associated H-X9-DG protein
VELLVVIFTLGLLVAVLVPALAGARSQARDVVCRSNLRQLVLANLGYAAENDGFFVPAARDMWDNAGLHRWHGARGRLGEPFDPARGPLAAYLGEGAIKECPGAGDFLRSDDWNASFERGGGGYGYNMTYLGSRLWDPGMQGPDAFRAAYERTTAQTEVDAPGSTLMFADTAMANETTSLIEYSFAEPPFFVVSGQVLDGFFMSPSVHFRHRARANVAWADAHVDGHAMAPVAETNAYGIDSAGMGLGWFAPVDNTLFDLE